MLRIKTILLSLGGISAIILGSFLVVSATQPLPSIESTEFGCTPDFWKNNLELWKVVGVDYNDDFDETFGTDYFEPNITLEQAINAEGIGVNHLARSGTAAYLDALVNPYADVEILREYVHDNHLKGLNKFISLCVENKNR